MWRGVAGTGHGHVRGVPYRVRVQLFPDGRCGVAVNGRAVWLSAAPALGAASARVALQGMSVDARMLVGRVTVFTGVKPDVDWSRVPNAIAAPR